MNKRLTYLDNKKNISENLIKDLRKKFNLSIEDLAIKLQLGGIDMSSQVIRNIENNTRTVTDTELFIISKILKVTIIINEEGIKYEGAMPYKWHCTKSIFCAKDIGAK